jgi:hypothetical protein
MVCSDARYEPKLASFAHLSQTLARAHGHLGGKLARSKDLASASQAAIHPTGVSIHPVTLAFPLAFDIVTP